MKLHLVTTAGAMLIFDVIRGGGRVEIAFN